MGAVYLAEHPLIGKKVALKVIHRELAGNKEVVQRFFQEAKAVNADRQRAHRRDPRLRRDARGRPLLHHGVPRGANPRAGARARARARRDARAARRRADRERAGRRARRRRHPPRPQARQRHADARGSAIRTSSSCSTSGSRRCSSAASAVKTAAGVLLGTPQYMSPEACESARDIDHRTDIYALGILLFQMMTGVLPFDGESMGEVLVKQVTQLPPAPRAINPNDPAERRADHPALPREAARRPVPDDARAARGAARSRGVPAQLAADRAGALGRAGRGAGQRARTWRAAAAQQKTRIGTGAAAAAAGAGAVAARQRRRADDDRRRRARAARRAVPVPGHRAAARAEDEHDADRDAARLLVAAAAQGVADRAGRSALLLGLGGGAFAVAYFGARTRPRAEAASPDGRRSTRDARSTPIVTARACGVDAGRDVGRDAGGTAVRRRRDAAPPRRWRIVVIDSAPQGAEVVGPDKQPRRQDAGEAHAAGLADLPLDVRAAARRLSQEDARRSS